MAANHVTFDDHQYEAGPSTYSSIPSSGAGAGAGGPGVGPSIHPDRLALAALGTPHNFVNGDAGIVKKKKVKSEKQKNREKKKLKKRRKLEQAKKAAAPKNSSNNQKEWKVDPVLEALKRSTVSSSANKVKNDTEDLGKEEDKYEDKVKKDVQNENGDVSEEVKVKNEKEKRKLEKREKREQRERKEIRKAQREKAALESNKSITNEGESIQQNDEIEMMDQEQPLELNDDDDNDDNDSKIDEDNQISRSESPPPLERFPLPTSAPAPAPEVLARQGLPTGLEDAEFIDQSLRISLDDLKTIPRKGQEQGEQISDRMKLRLKESGVQDFFAVQAAILPQLLSLRLLPFPYDELHDYLISAPTGSGKTLAYAVPIVEILSKRITPRLRALIVLPTRDLVVQVRDTLELLAKGSGLNIGSVTGQHSFSQEQSQLVADMETPLLGGSSKLDILIATPGRLMDHLSSTPNFTLQHLRFLVIDEADRLLNQSFQNWLSQVLSYINPPDPPRSLPEGFKLQPWDKVAPSWQEGLGLINRDAEWYDPIPSTCQKLLFSATLTRDPSKVAALSLSSPKYYIVQSTSIPSIPYNIGETFAFPTELKEKMLILPPQLKPLNLIHLIHCKEYNVDKALVFTKSVESSERLVRLLEYFEDAYILGGGGGKRIVVKGYTGELKPNERKKLLVEFAEGTVNLLVCSDLIARGMDLPSVSNVVSYDIPLDLRKYVHRVGRTARAGREGTAWTLVEKQEALHFKGMMNTANHLKAIRKVKVKEEDLSGYRDSYDIAMRRLKEHYGRDT
ncbi:uncharacterized protein IL334_007838 [Kwoniella shivajii]|uniref:ATP-dependent RNA helicase n=1 Tax=Kwoniella shivajii TaxID=564305 RepID=A0ABZ1D9T6_9TREE|nr:hypothetical protein IL334_007838 [Kwoniella shivajii]